MLVWYKTLHLKHPPHRGRVRHFANGNMISIAIDHSGRSKNSVGIAYASPDLPEDELVLPLADVVGDDNPIE
jgi:hypothetical protein